MAEWMYAHDLPPDMHPQGCTCGGCDGLPQEDDRPICFACGEPMEWTGEYKQVEMEGGMLIFEDPTYQCVNPDCWDE